MLRRGPGLVRMATRTAVVAGTATAVSGRVAHKQQAKYEAQQGQAAAAAPAAEAAAPAAAEDDVVDQLKELAALHTAGVLSDAEFDAAKAKLLG